MHQFSGKCLLCGGVHNFTTLKGVFFNAERRSTMWEKKEIKKAIELRNQGYNSHQISRMLDGRYSAPAVRRKLMREGYPLSDVMDNNYDTQENADGTQTSSTILEVIKGEELTPEDILKAHHYDPARWEIISNTSNFWKQKPESTLYQSKIKIKPKNTINLKEIAKIFNENIKPIEVNNQKCGKNNLVVPLFDMHFSMAKFNDYVHVLVQLKEIMARGFKSIVVINGGDLWESDQINSAQTVKGTILNDVDMVQGIRDAKRFYDEVITCAVANSEHVDVYTTMGNHSGDLEYLFIDALSDRFPQIDVHNTDKYRQAFLLDEVGIMIGHGDRTNKKLNLLIYGQRLNIEKSCMAIGIFKKILMIMGASQDNLAHLSPQTSMKKLMVMSWHTRS